MTPRPRRATALTRDEIVEVARDLFVEHGYAVTTIEDIATALGVWKGGVYYHVPRKSDLLVDIMTGLLVPLRLKLQEIQQVDAPPLEKLSKAAEFHVRYLLEHQASARVFFEERRALPKEARDQLDALSEVIHGVFRSLVSGACGGHSLDCELLTLHVLAVCNWPYRWFDPTGRASIEEVAKSARAYACAMVRAAMSLPAIPTVIGELNYVPSA